MATLSPALRGESCLEPLIRASSVLMCLLAWASSLCLAYKVHSDLDLYLPGLKGRKSLIWQ